jgi:hypothetical protein
MIIQLQIVCFSCLFSFHFSFCCWIQWIVLTI